MTLLLKAERFTLLTIFALLAYTLLATEIWAARVDWLSFLGSIQFYGIVAIFGLLLRLCNIVPHIAAMLFTIGLMPIFATVQSITTMLHFPLQRPLIDAQLFWVDG